MPKLDGIEYKELYGLSVDKENKELFFNDASHLYVNKKDGSHYISVTTLIGEYENKFDEEFWSKYKALELFLDGDVWSNVKLKLQATKRWDNSLLEKYKVNLEEFNKEVDKIKQEWALNRDEACEHGSYVHSLMENTFYGNTQFDFSKYGYAEASGLYDCPRNYFELDLPNAVYPEFLMSWTSDDGKLPSVEEGASKAGAEGWSVCGWSTTSCANTGPDNKKSTIKIQNCINFMNGSWSDV